MTETAVLQALFLYLPYIAALGLAFLARSRAARGLLTSVSVFMLAAIVATLVLTQGCRSNDLSYFSCPLVGPAMASFLSSASLLLLVAHVFLMPVLGIVAATLEWRVRRRG